MCRRKTLSSFGSASFEHQAPVLGGHARAEAVRFGSATVVRLKGTFRHRYEFSSKTKTLRLIAAPVYVKKLRAFWSGLFEQRSRRGSAISPFNMFAVSILNAQIIEIRR